MPDDGQPADDGANDDADDDDGVNIRLWVVRVKWDGRRWGASARLRRETRNGGAANATAAPPRMPR